MDDEQDISISLDTLNRIKSEAIREAETDILAMIETLPESERARALEEVLA
jgi:hypothetical protein